MPKPEIWLVKDTTNNTFLKTYDVDLENCVWGVSLEAIHYSTEEDANDIIESWDEEPGARFIGSNPPPPHP